MYCVIHSNYKEETYGKYIKKMGKKPKHDTKQRHQTTREERNRKTKKQRGTPNSQETLNKTAVSKYLIIVTLDV